MAGQRKELILGINIVKNQGGVQEGVGDNDD